MKQREEGCFVLIYQNYTLLVKNMLNERVTNYTEVNYWFKRIEVD